MCVKMWAVRAPEQGRESSPSCYPSDMDIQPMFLALQGVGEEEKLYVD